MLATCKNCLSDCLIGLLYLEAIALDNLPLASIALSDSLFKDLAYQSPEAAKIVPLKPGVFAACLLYFSRFLNSAYGHCSQSSQ